MFPKVAAAAGAGTRRMYGTYWRRIVEQWGDRRLDDPTATQIEQLVAYFKQRLTIRRNTRGGRSASEHLISAFRCVYRHAEADGWIQPADNPASKVAKPRRLPSARRAIPAQRLAEINNTAAATGNDPELDTLLLRLHEETACRRGGALALRPRDLDVQQCLIYLREKGETWRWQPVSPTLNCQPPRTYGGSAHRSRLPTRRIRRPRHRPTGPAHDLHDRPITGQNTFNYKDDRGRHRCRSKRKRRQHLRATVPTAKRQGLSGRSCV